MKDNAKSFIKKVTEKHKNHKKNLGILFCLSLLVIIGVFWELRLTGVALSNRTIFCGHVEHFHTAACGFGSHNHSVLEGCYQEQTELICPLDETASLENGDETENQHIHSEECYQRELLLVCPLASGESYNCGLEEHIHTLSCYSDKEADLEMPQKWADSFGDFQPSGDWSKDILSIARSQLGYRESRENYEVRGEQIHGYTRYGQWYGEPYEDWSGSFVSFCVHYANIPSGYLPRALKVEDWAEALRSVNLLELPGDYSPMSGDTVFFDVNRDGSPSKMGIVSNVDKKNNLIYIIEGDYEDSVCENGYRLDSEGIYGYGNLWKAYYRYDPKPRAVIGFEQNENHLSLNLDIKMAEAYHYQWEYYDQKWTPFENTSDPSLVLKDDMKAFLQGGGLVRCKVLKEDRMVTISDERYIPSYPLISLKASINDGIEVILSGPSRSFPPSNQELQLHIEEMTLDEINEELNRNGGGEILEKISRGEVPWSNILEQRFFRVYLVEDGEKIQLAGPVEMSFRGLAETKDSEEYGIYQIKQDQIICLESRTLHNPKGEISIDTEDLNYFMLTKESSDSDTSVETLPNQNTFSTRSPTAASISVSKNWYQANGNDLGAFKEDHVEIQLKRKHTLSGTSHNVHFRTYTTAVKYETLANIHNIPKGSRVEFAAYYKWAINYHNPTKVTYNGVEISPTGGYILLSGQHNTPKYQIDPVDKNATVNIDFYLNAIKNDVYLWYEIIPPSIPPDQIVHSVILNETNAWSYSWDNLPVASSDGIFNYYYYVEETKIAGIPTNNSHYQVSYVNNDGIQAGNIIVKNTSAFDYDYSLPETGGKRGGYTISGLIMMALSLAYGYTKKNERGV